MDEKTFNLFLDQAPNKIHGLMSTKLILEKNEKYIKTQIQEINEKLRNISDVIEGRGGINNNKHENNGDSQWTKNVKFSISQIADFLEITPDTVRKILKRFNLKFEYVKGKIVFSHEVAEKLIEYQNNKRKNRIKALKSCPI